MIEINAPFPDVTVNCPKCELELVVGGYEFEPSLYSLAKGVAHCEVCDEEFLVVLGGD
jgi:ribosomal protein S27E